jgi:4-amino-4-deoxy-L-arabinose transferase-like glycosyltransferase
MNSKFFSRKYLLSDIAILIYLSLFKLLLHFFTNTNYGLHRDEFLYIDMGNHLAWGYLEVPPNIAIFAKISHFIFGNSIFGYRFFPALTGAALVFVTGLIARELGGKKFALVVASLCVIFSPAFLRVNSLFQPVCFEQLYWTVGAYLLILIIKRKDQRLWVILGLVMGLGLLNKYSILLFALANFAWLAFF